MTPVKIIIKVLLGCVLFITITSGIAYAKNLPEKNAGSTAGNIFYSIAGPGDVAQQYYAFSCTPAIPSGGSWNVVGGTVIHSNAGQVIVFWNSGANGVIEIKDAGGVVLASHAITYGNSFFSFTMSNPVQTINSGTAPSEIIPTGQGPSGTTYSWQKSFDGVNYDFIPGQGGITYQPGILNATTFFRRLDTRTQNGITFTIPTSNAVVVVLNPPLIAGNISPSYQVVDPNAVPANLSLSNVTGGTGAYNYLWQKSTTGGTTWDDIGPAQGLQCTPPVFTGNTLYRVRVESGGEFAFSNTAAADQRLIAGAVHPAQLAIGSNSRAGISVSAPTGGNCTTYGYQWQISADGTNFSNISGAGSSSYQSNPLSVITYFRCIISCGGQTVASGISTITVVSGTNANVNYIRTIELSRPATEAATVELHTNPAAFRQTTEFFDGLGRSMQRVARRDNPENKDMVELSVYDNMGREALKYLPYVAQAADGGYKPNALTEQTTFNQTEFPNEQLYYSKNEFEASPMGRVVKTMRPGQSWVGSNVGITTKYWFNTDADDVKIWQVNDVVNDWGTYTLVDKYTAGKLYKNVITDERNIQIIEFRDKENKLILKKEQLTASADNGLGKDHTGWLCTYFVYDARNNLRLVIQPKGVELLQQNSWNINALNGAILNEQTFRYEYDQRSRLIRRKLPGAEEVWMVYDVLDRVVMTQDGSQRTRNEWLTTLYDKINRPVVSGLLIYSNTLPNMQQLITTQTTSPAPAPPGTPADPELIGVYSGVQQATNSITMVPGFETADNLEFLAEIVGGNEETNMDGTTVYKNPIPSGALFTVIARTGYDSYSAIPSASGLSGSIDNTFTGSDYLITTYNTSPKYAREVVQSMQTKGKVTWSQTKILASSSSWLYTVNIYDENGRLIQVKTKNQTGGTDVTTMQYSFSGQPLVTVTKTEKAGAVNPQTYVVVTKMDYDLSGRLLSVRKAVNGTANNVTVSKPETEISVLQYTPLGQMKTKSLGKKKDASGNYLTSALETLDYSYNLHGWLLGMNRDYLLENASGKYFGFELGYDKLTNKANRNFIAAMLNGNIGGLIWKSAGDGIRRKYDFVYDAVNRLLKADFEQQNDDDHAWNNNKVNYSVLMGNGTDATTAYDANGNILRMQQWGRKLMNNFQMDDLRYTYYDNSNKLKNIVDFNTDDQNNLGDFKTSVSHPQRGQKTSYIANPGSVDIKTIIDYTYDDNGNLKKDLNKDIGTSSVDGITYNFLNQPEVITFRKADGNVKAIITYTYDATGNKLKKVAVDNSINNKTITTTTTYSGGAVYESRVTVNPGVDDPADYTDKLQFLLQEEGRIRFTPAGETSPAHFDYDYFIKDHLGNIRMTLTDQQEQLIYPAATLEGNGAPATDPVTVEKRYYDINNGFIGTRPPNMGTYQNNNGNPPVNNNPNCNDNSPIRQTDNSAKTYRLNANELKTGLSFAIKVMSGDKINIFGKSYYQDNNTGGSSSNIPVLVSELINGLLGAPAGIGSGKTNAVELNGSSVLTNALNDFITRPTRNDPNDPVKPKAAINWILLDDNFKYVTGNFSPVGAVHNSDAALKNIPVTKNGYLYVYVSNESPVNVYFDNLQVVHDKGPVLEESHYYPFGLTMAAISSRMIGSMENKYGYNGKEQQNNEWSDGSGLEWYDYGARMFDPQIGRWNKMDPMAAEYFNFSAYNYVGNDPLNYTDPTGMLRFTIFGDEIQKYGLTLSDLARFADIILNFDKVLDLDRANEFIGQLKANTGLSESQIRRDLKAGGGPTIILKTFTDDEFEAQDTRNETITMDIRPFLELQKVDVNNKRELAIQAFDAVIYILHEYVHYGDKKTNNGNNSGQTVRHSWDYAESTQQNGPQKKTAITGHRGSDMDQFILFGSVMGPGQDPNEAVRRSAVLYDRGNRTISTAMRNKLVNSPYFNISKILTLFNLK